jgi:uncharacterized membrane protein YraQ (UPF0718 family)
MDSSGKNMVSRFRFNSSTGFRRLARAVPFVLTAGLLGISLLHWAGSLLGGLPPGLLHLLDGASVFGAVFLGIFIEAAPFLLLGTLASGLVEVFISREDLAGWMPKGVLTGVLVGALLGLFFPVSEVGALPLARRLLRKGMPLPTAVALLLAAPVVNPIVIVTTRAAFGPGLIFWGRIGATLLIAVGTGVVFGLAVPKDVLHGAELKLAAVPHTEWAAHLPVRDRLRQMLVIAADEFIELGSYLAGGAFLAALLQTLIPQAGLLAIGQGPLLSLLVMIVLAVLLSAGSAADTFIAAGFLAAFPAGSVLAFLVYGPMVDIKNLLLFSRVFKPRALVILALLPLLLIAVIAVGVNLR